MSAYSQIYSNATDFVGSVNGDVDPRTGQFTIKISLGALIANNGQGPKVPLDLIYSPMTQANLGFGVGFGFGFTTYDQRSTLLSLSSGSQYKVLEKDDVLSLIDAKLQEVNVEKLDGQYYKAMYKDGSFELLTNPNAVSSLKVPYKIVSADGHFITLNWEFRDNIFRLLSIIDENHNTLVAINYPDAQNCATKIAVLPDRQVATQGSDCVEGYNVYLFFGDNYHLTKVTCDAADGLEWKIGYTNLSGLGPWGQIASSVAHPGGLHEYVNYSKSKGHRFGSARADMAGSLYPYVTDFTHVPGGKQPIIVAHYDYEIGNSHNFLGHAAPGIFARNPTLDALYNCTDGSYRYHTLETHYDDGGVKTQVERSYNCFHQLIETKSVTQNCSITTCTEYYSAPGSGFEVQVSNFQCPKTKTVIWSRLNPNTGTVIAKSQAVENFTYDHYGNILEKSGTYTDVNGTSTPIGTITYDYYPADIATPYAEETGYGCPADPNSYNRTKKIPRFIRSQTITPNQFHGDELPKQTRYAYTQYDMPDAVVQLLAPSDPDHSTCYAVMKTEQRIYHNKQTLQEKTACTYADKTAVLPESQMSEFGQLLQTIDTFYPNDGVVVDPTDPKTAASFDTTTKTNVELVNSNNDLKTTSTVTTWDKLTASTTQTSSRFTSRVTEKEDAMGIKTHATYDALGRVLSVTTAAKTKYADTRTLSYEIGDTGLVDTVIDTFGNRARVTADGAGKPIKGEVKLSGASSSWQVMETRDYDNAGRLNATTTHDYSKSTDATPYGSVTSTNHYDNWGRIDYVTTLDDIQHFSVADPIAMTQTEYSKSGGNNPLTTSKTVTSVNPVYAAIATQIFASDNTSTTPDSTTTQTYDGWKKLRATTDELGRITTYDYDDFGRVVTTTLPVVNAQIVESNIVINYPANDQTVAMPTYMPGSTSQTCSLDVAGIASPNAVLNLNVDGVDSGLQVHASDTGGWKQTVYIVAPPTGSTPHTIIATESSNPTNSATVNFNSYSKHSTECS